MYKGRSLTLIFHLTQLESSDAEIPRKQWVIRLVCDRLVYSFSSK